MSKTTNQIAQVLQDKLEPHIPRVSEATAYLVKNAGVSPTMCTESFNGLANALVLCHFLAAKSGWWQKPDGSDIDPNDPYVFGTKISLIHSEISEALEGGRKNTWDEHLMHRRTVEVEFADAIIRIFDTAGAMGLDVAGALIEKLAYNQQRADHKLAARAGAGGKAF